MTTQADESSLSRRRVLGRLSAAAVGGGALAVSTVALPGPASAGNGDSLVLGNGNNATANTYLTTGSSTAVSLTIGTEVNATSLEGRSNYVGLWGRSVSIADNTKGEHIGVLGEAENTCGHAKIGVRGKAVNGGGTGVEGISRPYGYGVQGFSSKGFGVRGVVDDPAGIGVAGEGANGGVGVRGTVPNYGYGVRGTSGIGFGVRGEATTGIGVSGSAASGTAVSGQGRLGGEFAGTRAAVRLVPATTVGAPSSGSHARGELVCDKAGQLWFCKTGGTPGTWVRIA